MRRVSFIAALLLVLPAAAAADPALREGVGTSPATAHETTVIAEASCASLCRQRHNQCRIQTRGSQKCDSELQRCLNGCLATKRR